MTDHSPHPNTPHIAPDNRKHYDAGYQHGLYIGVLIGLFISLSITIISAWR